MDKMYINFYFDESGSTGYFVVGGFYLFSSSLEEIEEIERKLSKNIYLTEKSIKRYLKLNNMERYDSQSKELKFRTIDHENLIYFFNNLNNYGQENICIISDIKKWKNKHTSIDAIYNMMTNHIIERTIKRLLKHRKLNKNNKIQVKIEIDQRRTIPVIKDMRTQNKFKLQKLNDYLYYQLNKNIDLKEELIVELKLKDSQVSTLIRYADFYVGTIGSMCRFLDSSKNNWDKRADEVFSLIHDKFNCKCMSTLQKNSKTINIVVSECNKHRNEKKIAKN